MPGLILFREIVISTGIIFYVSGLKNLYRSDVDLQSPVVGGLTALEILFKRFQGRGSIAGMVLSLPDSEEYASLAGQAKILGINVSRFAAASVQEKPLILQQQRWNLEDDSGNDTWLGAAFAQAITEMGWQTALMVPLTNLLVEPAAVLASLALHRRESFDMTAAEERICGAAWYIFEADLINGLMKSHAELMWARGGLAWALRKPLYPFKIGAYHCPRTRPGVVADLRLNSKRALHTISVAGGDDFASSDFSYDEWLDNSGWQTAWCDFAPLIVNVEPASLCQASCFACVYPQMQRDKMLMTPEIFAKITDSFAPGDDCRWVFSGMGEPLLNPFIGQMVAKTSQFSSMLITSLQKPPVADFPYYALDQIRISTDALTEEDFRQRRNGCAWKNIENFLELARARKQGSTEAFPEIGVSCLRHLLSETQLQAFINYWKQVVRPVFREHFFRWPFDAPSEAIQWFQILGEAEFLKAHTRTSLVDFTPVRRRPCRNATLSLTVLSDGSVTVCPYDFEGKHVFANVKDASLKEIWHSETARNFRKKHLQLQLETMTDCQNCSDWYHPV